MDANPKFSLSFLYKNDPFYSLCLSDLMSASQSVNNQFLKEHRSLLETLKKIDHHQRSRIGQLNEERRQFALLMNRKLAPRVSRLSSLAGDRESRRTFSTKNFSDLASSKSSVRSFETVSTYSTGPAVSMASNKQAFNHTRHLKISRLYFTAVPPQNGCAPAPKRPTRSESGFPTLRQNIIGKTFSRTACKVK
ncbi:hypothetical protein FKM82_005079 [Ascaphus truei]